jgi:long-chain acyl-CoA synthetase
MEAVADNLREVRPTIVLAVPRFFEKMHARVLATVESAPAPRRKLFRWAIRVGKTTAPLRQRRQPLPLPLKAKMALAERLVFRKLKDRVGGRMRFFVSGSAPLPPHIADFFYAAGLTICEGYGLTETSPVISLNLPEDFRFGTVGKVIENVEVKIAPDDEILVRGPNIMKGYYKMEEVTRETLNGGWLRTGDIGRFDEDGYLVITDRKKDLLKTSGGKFVAPQPIENLLKTSPYVAIAVVIAEGRRFPSALLVPDFEKLERFARDAGIDCTDRSALVQDEKIQALFRDEVDQACTGLAQHEKIKKIVVVDREFSIANGEITPTLKVRRRHVEQLFKAEIERVYQ